MCSNSPREIYLSIETKEQLRIGEKRRRRWNKCKFTIFDLDSFPVSPISCSLRCAIFVKWRSIEVKSHFLWRHHQFDIVALLDRKFNLVLNSTYSRSIIENHEKFFMLLLARFDNFLLTQLYCRHLWWNHRQRVKILSEIFRHFSMTVCESRELKRI